MKKTYLKPEIDETVISMNAIMAGSGSTVGWDKDGNEGEYGDDEVGAKGAAGSIWPE